MHPIHDSGPVHQHVQPDGEVPRSGIDEETDTEAFTKSGCGKSTLPPPQKKIGHNPPKGVCQAVMVGPEPGSRNKNTKNDR